MTATAIRVYDDSLGTSLTDDRYSYSQGLTYNATQDRFYFAFQGSSSTFAQIYYVEGDLSSAGTIGSGAITWTNGNAASDDGDYLCIVRDSTSPSTGYYLGRLTCSTESYSAQIQSWSPSWLTPRAKIACTGTDSFVILYHGPTEKVMGTNYERLYYRTYVPSTDTLGSETLLSGTGITTQTSASSDFSIVPNKMPVGMRGNYTQDRAGFSINEAGGTDNEFIYYDASAGTWTGIGTFRGRGEVHNYNAGTEEFFTNKNSGGNVSRYDGWDDTTATSETVTDSLTNGNHLLHVDHANDEVYLTQVSSTSNVRYKKRNTSGTWDSSWTDESITLTSATSIRTDISNDARYFDFGGGSTALVRTAVTNQSSGRGLHFIKINLAGGTSVTREPASTTVAVTLPQTARTAGSTLTPAPVAAGPQFAVPTPTRSGGASRTPDAVAAAVTLPQVTVTTTQDATPQPEPVSVGTSTPQTSVLTTELQLSGFALTATYTEAAATVVNPAPVTVAATLPQVTVVAQLSATTTPDPITVATTVPQAVRSGGAVRTPDPVAAAASLPQAAPVASASRTPDAVAVAVTVPQAVRSGSTSLAVEPVSVAVAIPQVTITSVTNVTRTPEPVSVGVSLPSATVLAAASRTVEPVAVAVAVPQAVRSGSTSQSPASVAVAVASPQATPTGAASRTVEPVSVAVAVPQAVRQGGAVRTPDPVAAAISVPQVTLVTVTDATVTPDPLLVALVFPEAATSITEIPETPTVAVALPQVGRSGSTDRSPTPITVSLAVPQATTTSTALKTIEPIAVSVSLPLASVSLFEPAPTEPTTVGISLPQLTRSAGASREAITSVSVVLPQHTWQGDALVTSRSTGEFDTGFDFGFNTSHSLIASVGVFFPQVSVVGTKSITVTPDPVAVATSLPLAAALVDATVVLAPVAVAGSLPQAVFQGTALRTTVPVSVLVASPQATPSVAFPFSLYATGDGTTADVVNELDTTTNLWQSVDDDPLSPNDADWINNTKVTASQFFDLTDVPGDFESFDRMTMKVRWNGQLHSSDIALYVQLFESDETSSLSDEMLVATATGDTAFANTSDISFTGLDTVSDKTVWDGARIRFRWGAV